MKRPGKCVGKVKFQYSYLAIERAKHWYLKNGTKLGYYECPTCLDFHLTSKYCNLTHLHPSWKPELPGNTPGKRTKAQKRRDTRNRAKARKLLGLPPIPPPPPKKKQVWSGDINAALSPYQKETEHWWQRLLGAIIRT